MSASCLSWGRQAQPACGSWHWNRQVVEMSGVEPES